jgi:cation/acetate symporter
MTDIARQLPGAADERERLARDRAVAGLIAFVAVFALLAFVVATLSEVGVPQTILVWLVAIFALAVPAFAAIPSRTVSLTEFAVAGRRLTAAENTMAATAGLFGGVFPVGLGAAFFRSEAEASALVLGLAGGCLLSGVLLAPYLRRSAAQSPGHFLMMRFGSRTLAGLCGIALAAAFFAMLAAELSLAGRIGGWMLGVRPSAAIVAAAGLVLVPPLLGGMRGLTVAAVLQFVLVVAGLVVASIWVSVSATGRVLPVAGYLSAAANLQAVANTAVPAAPWGLAGLALCVALGIAVFPALLSRPAAAGSAQGARRSTAWITFFVAVLAMASVSMAACAKWLVEDAPGHSRSIADLLAQPWVVDWVDRDSAVVTLCGAPASEAGATCTSGPPQPGDLAIDPDIALLAAPDIAGLPPLSATLAGAALAAGAIAAGSLLLFGIGRALGHDALFLAAMPRMPASRRLLVERLVLVLAAIGGVYATGSLPADYFRIAMASLSLGASALFPALLLGVWWPRANRAGALAGMLAGAAIASFLAYAGLYDPTALEQLGGLGLAGWAGEIGAEKAALAGVPVGLLIAVVMSLLTPAPGPTQRAFAAALLSPRDMQPLGEVE